MFNLLFVTVGFDQGFNYAAASFETFKEVFPEADFLYITRDETRRSDKTYMESFKTNLYNTLMSKDLSKYDFVLGTGDLFFKKYKFNLSKPTVEFNNVATFCQADHLVTHMGPEGVGNVVSEKHLYIEPREDDRITVFVDHVNRKRSDQTYNILQYLKSVKSKYNLKILHQGPNGILEDDFDPVLDQGYKKYSLQDLAEVYRQTDVFFPTHRETMGQVALEFGACGAFTVLQQFMYPKEVIDRTNYMYYNDLKQIDWSLIQQRITTQSKDDTRKKVLQNCSPVVFREKILSKLRQWSDHVS